MGGEKANSSPGPTPFPWAGGTGWAVLQCGGADFRGALSRVVKCIPKVIVYRNSQLPGILKACYLDKLGPSKPVLLWNLFSAKELYK